MTAAALCISGMARPTQDACGQSDDRDKQLKDSSHRDAYEAEGQKQ
jgi:hypothetical protein